MKHPNAIKLRVLPENTTHTMLLLNKSAGDQMGITSNVYVDSKSLNSHRHRGTGVQGLVFKQVVKYAQDAQPLEREVCMLRKLAGLSWAPQISCYDHRSYSLITPFVGAPLRLADLLSIPHSVQQMHKILTDMEQLGLEHRDIAKPYGMKLLYKLADQLPTLSPDKLREILPSKLGLEMHVSMPEERLRLVDFGMGQVNGSFACNSNISSKAPQVTTKHINHGIPDREVLKLVEKLHRAANCAVLKAFLAERRSPTTT